MAESDPTKRAEKLLRSGKKEEARELIASLLKHDNNNARGWTLLYYAAKNRQEALLGLRQVLRLRPDDAWAVEQLARLEGEPLEMDLLEPRPDTEHPQETDQQRGRTMKFKGGLREFMLGFVPVFGVGAIIIAIIAGSRSARDIERDVEEPPTPAPVFTITPAPSVTINCPECDADQPLILWRKADNMGRGAGDVYHSDQCLLLEETIVDGIPMVRLECPTGTGWLRKEAIEQ